MSTRKNTLRKDERLCNHTMIANLFKKNTSIFEYPFKVVYYMFEENDPFDGNHPAQILFSVPKRQFKKAVQRNTIRRLLKEGYRKSKYILYDYLESKHLKIAVGLIFIAKAPLSATETEQKIIKSLQRLTQTIQNSLEKTNSKKTS